MIMTSVFILNVLSALFNSALSIYITNSKRYPDHDKLLIYLAFIITCSTVIVDIIYCILGQGETYEQRRYDYHSKSTWY